MYYLFKNLYLLRSILKYLHINCYDVWGFPNVREGSSGWEQKGNKIGDLFVQVGDGNMGAHYTIVFALYVFEIFHEKCFFFKCLDTQKENKTRFLQVCPIFPKSIPFKIFESEFELKYFKMQNESFVLWQFHSKCLLCQLS